GRSSHRRDAAGDRPVAIAQNGGVATHDDDPLDVHTELGRAYLRERRLVGLALGRHADLEIDRPARVDLDVGALERADSGALEIRGQADPDRPCGVAAHLLRAPPLVVAEVSEQVVSATP